MPKRNMPLTNNTVYHVFKEDGKHYTVYSQQTLKAKIERGEITESDRVVIQRVQ